MDIDILEFKDKIESLRNKAEKILDNYKREGFDNQRAYKEIEWFVEHLDDCIRSLKYYSKPTIQGELRKKNNGRFELIPIKHEFCSGYDIEILIDDEWCVGSVEYTHGEPEGYYFKNTEGKNEMLKNGMIARIRIEE